LFDPGSLGEDIRATLKEEHVTPGAELTVAVKYPEDALVEMRVICERGEPPQKAAAGTIAHPTLVKMVPARLRTITGVSSAVEFALDRPRINLGREAEITDALGRAIRRNE